MTRSPDHRAPLGYRSILGLAADGPGGTMARWLLPVALVVPAALNLVSFALQRAGLVDPGVSAAFHAATSTAVAVVAVLLTAQRMDRLDADRRRQDSEVRLSEARFRDMFDDAPTGYHELDAEGRLIRVNRTELSILGYAAEEMLGRHPWEFVEDQEASRTAVLAKLSGALPPSGQFERAYCGKDGTQVSALLQDQVLRDGEGRITGIRTTLQNITHLKRVEAERQRLIEALQTTLAEIKTLKGFIPICASCRKVRDDQGYWEQVESYVTRHTDASFSHGICPECAKTLYPELQENRGPE